MIEGLIAAGLGIPLVIAIYVIVQIVSDPNKIDKYKSLITSPFYKLGRWSSKTYIASKVSYQVTEFFNRHINMNIANQDNVKISINWVDSEQDPILKEDNTIIVCLRKDKNQARNILKATEQAIPLITHKYLRTNMDSHIENSIDLTTLRNLANKLGNHGKFAFKEHFLKEKIQDDERISELFQKLVQIDNRGYFVPIFLNELEYVSDGIFANGDLKNHSTEIIEFIEYLIHISEVEVGTEVDNWSYFSEIFSTGILLLANNARMIQHGVKPYIDRISKGLKQGYESIYILSEENSWEFLKKLEKIIDGNDRVLIKGKYQANGIVKNDNKRKSQVKIVLLRKIDVVADNLFIEKIRASEIEVGKRFMGEVVDISEKLAIITILGIDCFIRKNECSWYSSDSCKEHLELGQKEEFVIKNIDENKMSIELSLKFEEKNPWLIKPLPAIDSNIGATIFRKNGLNFYAKDSLGHEITIPIQELSWVGSTEQEIDEQLNKKLQVKIIEVDEENEIIKASIRQLKDNPWKEINNQLTKGTELIGYVSEVNSFFVRVNLEYGINGIIPKERLLEAGGVYSDYQNNIVVGQGLEVVVTRVFIAKRKIHIDLKK